MLLPCRLGLLKTELASYGKSLFGLQKLVKHESEKNNLSAASWCGRTRPRWSVILNDLGPQIKVILKGGWCILSHRASKPEVKHNSSPGPLSDYKFCFLPLMKMGIGGEWGQTAPLPPSLLFPINTVSGLPCILSAHILYWSTVDLQHFISYRCTI